MNANIIDTTKSIIDYLKKHYKNTDLNKLVQDYSFMSQISENELDYVDAIIGLLIHGNTPKDIISLLL